MPKELHPLKVVIRPLITEKATRLGSEGKYVFEVQRRANKRQIKEAVEKGFDVGVVKVNVMIMKGKSRRIAGNRTKKSPSWKKAIVTLVAGDRIELFEGV
jgi:large subunit ribosomal protein L23